ncbi:MAG: response regulator [Candidatus Omnitrophica bacterium]|nr:response regulator [Candidatus Omnitrophota bacterium]
MSPIKVLMADDEPDVLAIMAKKIKAAGYDVVTAADGQEAWDKIIVENPDVILLDITMPKLEGFEVLQRLRETPPSKKWQPVIIISAREELKDIQKGYSLEADHYLTKPCNIDDVLNGIRLMAQLIPQHKTPGEY